MGLKLRVLGILALFGLTANSQNVRNILDKYFTGLSKNQEFNGSILYSENGNILYQGQFGYSNFQTKQKNTDATLINIASVSKTITSLAILKLKEANKLNLDETFSKYFDAFPYPDITIKHLLSHTSGLPDNEALLDSLYIKNPTKIFTNSDIIPALIEFKKYRDLRFKPGEKWGYSNIGYSLLALLIEKISNQPFDEYVRQNIFIPAKMKSTYIQTNLSQKNDRLRCQNYMYNNHFEMKLQQIDTIADWKKYTYNFTGLTGSTNVISNLKDLLAFSKALNNKEFFTLTSQEEAYNPVRLNNGEINKAAQGSYGLGWFIEIDSINNKTVSHSGAAPGVTTYFIKNLTSNQTLIILQNVQNPMFDIGAILDILKGKHLTYKKSIAFLFAQEVYKTGFESAKIQLLHQQSDTINYILKEKEMARVGLEFSRSRKFQNISIDVYRLNTELFPKSWKAFEDYANALLNIKEKNLALKMLKKSFELNPANQNVKKLIEQLSTEVQQN